MIEVPISYPTMIDLRVKAKEKVSKALIDIKRFDISDEEMLRISDQVLLGVMHDLQQLGIQIQIREPVGSRGSPVEDPAQREQFVAGAVDDSDYREGRRRR